MDEATWSSSIILYINGKDKRVTNPDPKMTLLQFLRLEGLTGTKLGCGEGGCGACTVMVSWYNSKLSAVQHQSVNACLAPLCSLDGAAVTTIEGIGGMRQGLHPVQKRIATLHGSQCGFCTPGIVMSLYAHLRSNPISSQEAIEECLDGNLCRCTGYRPILDAAKSLASVGDAPKSCCGGGGGGGNCGVNGQCPCMVAADSQHNLSPEKCSSKTETTVARMDSLSVCLEKECYTEPIFPPFLLTYAHEKLCILHDGTTWYQPLTLAELVYLKQRFPQAKIVNGNTEIGIEVKFKMMEYSVLINPHRITELTDIGFGEYEGVEGLKIGAAVSINQLRDFIRPYKIEGKAKYRVLIAIYDMLTWFASNQIRNVASIAGNIATASPISDLNPMLLASGATLQFISSDGERELPIKEFFLAYRRVDIRPTEVLKSVFVPVSNAYEFVIPLKQARRREDDISIVTAGIRVRLGHGDGKWKIEDVAAAFGGMAPTTILAAGVAKELTGKQWETAALDAAIAALRVDLPLPDNVPGGQAQYRMSLAASFLFKAFLTITSELQKVVANAAEAGVVLPPAPVLDAREESAVGTFVTQHKSVSRGEQSYIRRSDPSPAADIPLPYPIAPSPGSGPVGESLMHKSALVQVTGEAIYTDDIPLPASAVHAALVMSARAHARLVSVDTTAAEASEGFVAYFSAKDVTGSNKIGAIAKDEEIFATEEVKHVGAVIGVILANTHEQATQAARKVVVVYEDLPAVVSIEEAITAKSFYPGTHEIISGDLTAEEAGADVVVSGSARVGGQDHFYLETNCSLAIPKEFGHLEVFSSTQNPTKTQNFCASVCGIPAAHVVSRCKRMGGGFGGKETRSVFIACTAALAAHLLNRPVSINIERDVDMSITGQRHAFLLNYRAGCTREGKLKFLDLHMFSNAGFSLDLSQPVMDRALFHCDNVYKWPALRARGTLCQTNQPSHTAFRGFGGPQGLMATETAIEHLAHALGMDPFLLRQLNFYSDGDRTHFGQPLVDFYVPRLWTELQAVSNLADRSAAVEEFNRLNRWKKRGIAVLPTKFGINFTAKFMNQGGALVHVYTDGTVLIAHGGTEMGQGLHTKMIQVAAHCFGISDAKVHIAETATNTVANASPTAASMSTDLFGMAVLDACNQILVRLKLLKESLAGDISWEDLIQAAFFTRVDLSAHGYFAVDSERCGYDWDLICDDNSKRGHPFNYFTQGAACAEVEIDCLTGDSTVLRVDVVMDVGRSINPTLDIGQIEGAFVQGMGWSTMEELVWGDGQHPWVRTGQLFTRGPGTYKIPSFNDVPRDMRIHLADTDNRFSVHSSKAVGEPPLFLGCSVYFAIQHAVTAARKESASASFVTLSAAKGEDDEATKEGATGEEAAAAAAAYYRLDHPATSERIRMACADRFTAPCTGHDWAYRPKGSW